MPSSLGKAKVIIAGEDKDLQRTLKRSRKAVVDFSKTAKVGLLAIGTAGIALAGATKQAAAYADTIIKTARATGLSSSSFQELSAAAARSGVATSTFESSMLAFNKRVGEAKNGTGALVTFLKKYDQTLLTNIQNSKSQEQALYLLSEAMSKQSDGSKRAALASAAFSRAGLKMELALKDGSAALDEGRKRAEKFGQVLHVDEAQVEALNDRMDEVATQVKNNLTEGLLAATPLVIDLANAFGELISYIGGAYNAMKEWLDQLPTQNRSEGLRDELSVQQEILKRQKEGLKQNNKVYEALGMSANRIAEKNKVARDAIKETEKEIQILHDKLELLDSNYKPSLPQVPKATAGTAGIGTGTEMTATGGQGDFTDAQIQKLKEEAEAREANRLRMEEYLKTWKEIKAAEEGAGKAATDSLSPLEQLSERWGQFGENMEYVGVSALENLTSGFADFATGSSANIEDMTKSILKNFAKIALQATIIKGLTGMGFSMPGIGGGKAGGGHVSPFTSYPVGEHGPELLTMGSRPGYITPHNKIGGSNVTVNITNKGTNQNVSDVSYVNNMSGQVINLILDDMNKNGKLGRRLNSSYQRKQ